MLLITEMSGGSGSYSYSVRKSAVLMPMRDSIQLSADVYFPEGVNEKLPVILIRTPNNKAAIGITPYYFASNGYAVVVQDVRGRFGSEGKWEPFINEACDGYDTVEWIAGQPWSNGKIGMSGGSYMASAQCLAAKMNPPHLTTIIPNCLPADPFRNSPWENGIFLLAPEAWWIYLIESGFDDYTNPAVINESQRIKDDPALFELPVAEIDRKILGREIDYWRKWLLNNHESEYWNQVNYIDELRNIKIPVLLQSGWYDTHLIGTIMAWKSLAESSGNNHKLIIGPWNHANVVPRYYSSVRNTGSEANVNILGLYLKWFDHWLKSADNGINQEDPVSIFIMNDNKWITSEDFPLRNPGKRKLYLGSTLGANSMKGDGQVSWDKPSSHRKYDSYLYDPADPTPAFIYRNSKGRRVSDSISSGRNDILVYETEPSDTSFTIAGKITAHISAASDARDTDWFVYMYGVDNKGEYFPLVHGCIRARFRNSFSSPELIKRGKTYQYAIDMWQTAIKIEKGWKLRVEISSSDFPQYSRNLNTGENNEYGVNSVSAKQKIYYRGKSASYIELPLL